MDLLMRKHTYQYEEFSIAKGCLLEGTRWKINEQKMLLEPWTQEPSNDDLNIKDRGVFLGLPWDMVNSPAPIGVWWDCSGITMGSRGPQNQDAKWTDFSVSKQNLTIIDH